MSVKQILIILMISLTIVIGNGCFLQPKAEIIREFYIVDYNAPALRIGKPVKAELWRKNPDTGKWEPIGEGIIPPGAYVKGRKPKGKTIEEILKEEDNGTGR